MAIHYPILIVAGLALAAFGLAKAGVEKESKPDENPDAKTGQHNVGGKRGDPDRKPRSSRDSVDRNGGLTHGVEPDDLGDSDRTVTRINRGRKPDAVASVDQTPPVADGDGETETSSPPQPKKSAGRSKAKKPAEVAPEETPEKE